MNLIDACVQKIPIKQNNLIGACVQNVPIKQNQLREEKNTIRCVHRLGRSSCQKSSEKFCQKNSSLKIDTFKLVIAIAANQHIFISISTTISPAIYFITREEKCQSTAIVMTSWNVSFSILVFFPSVYRMITM